MSFCTLHQFALSTIMGRRQRRLIPPPPALYKNNRSAHAGLVASRTPRRARNDVLEIVNRKVAIFLKHLTAAEAATVLTLLPCCPISLLPSFLPFFLPSFLPSLLPSFPLSPHPFEPKFCRMVGPGICCCCNCCCCC